ncbi:MAG: hypothetical protein P8046_05945 [Anaerolineales bacterium]
MLNKKFELNFAHGAKPIEPRGHNYNATIGHMLVINETQDHPEMVGVNSEGEHKHITGDYCVQGGAQALESGKLFHIDQNDQAFGRNDQVFRFGTVNLKSALFLVKLLDGNRYKGSHHLMSRQSY